MAHQEARLERIEDKLDSIVKAIGSIDTTIASQHISLEHHIKRTDLLERQLEPLRSHVSMIHGGLKLLGGCAVLFGVMESAVALLTYLRH